MNRFYILFPTQEWRFLQSPLILLPGVKILIITIVPVFCSIQLVARRERNQDQRFPSRHVSSTRVGKDSSLGSLHARP